MFSMHVEIFNIFSISAENFNMHWKCDKIMTLSTNFCTYITIVSIKALRSGK